MNWLKHNTDQQSLHFHLAKLREERREALLPNSFADTVNNMVPRNHITTNIAKHTSSLIKPSTPITALITPNTPISSVSRIISTTPITPITSTALITPTTPITPITSSTLITPITSVTPSSITPFTPTLTYENSSLLSQNLLTPHQEAQRIMRTIYVHCPLIVIARSTSLVGSRHCTFVWLRWYGCVGIKKKKEKS